MGRVKRIVLSVVAACVVALTATTAYGEAAGGAREISLFEHYFVEGGWVVWFIELPLSVAMGALTVMFVLEMRRSNLIPLPSLEQIRGLLENRQYREAIEFTASDPSQISAVVHSSLAEAGSGYPAMERAMEEAIDERSSKQLRKIEYLNIIGNIAPMVGLFGTVLGMIQTFNVIRMTPGTPDPNKLAGGISVALVTTFWGLLIAIPALSAFSLLRTQIEAVAGETAVRTQELLTVFNPAAQKAAAQAGVAGPAKIAPPPAPPRPVVPPSP